MLSAVAARKAALAQSQSADSLSVSVRETVSQPSPSPAKPPSVQKRKSNASVPQSTSHPKKQKSKSDALLDTRVRSQGVHTQDITPDDDGMHVDHQQAPPPREPPLPAAITFTGKRQWSPSRPVDSSSSSDGDEVNHLANISAFPSVVAPRPKDDATVLSTFSPVHGQNIFDITPEESDSWFGSSSSSSLTNAVLVVLRPRDSLCLLGTYQLNVLKGSVTIDGTFLTPSQNSRHIFAPRSSPLPIIRHRFVDEDTASVQVISVPARFRQRTGKEDTLLALRELRTGVEALGSIHPRFAGVFQPESRDTSISREVNELGINGVYLMRFSSPTIQPFMLSPSWQSSLEHILPDVQDEADVIPISSEAPIYLVRGPKKTGKSTFARTLLNRLLSRYRRVAFLECDLGQSEFTPAGMVALTVLSQPVFGPSFTHQTISHRAHYIGATTPRDAPAHYIAAVDACLNVYRLDIARAVDLPDEHGEDEDDGRITDFIPLVVNTMGWTKGLGADLNQQVTSLVAPTHTFEFSPLSYGDRRGSSQTLPQTAEIVGSGLVQYLDPVDSPLSAYYTAADHRALNILSYFHAIFPTVPDPRNAVVKAWTPVHLLSRAPYEVQWHVGLPGGLVLSAPGGEDVVPGEVVLTLPGAIIALTIEDTVAVSYEAPQIQARHNAALNYTQGRPAPSPGSSHCLGLALVRGLSALQPSPRSSDSPPSSASASGATVQLLTPIPLILLGRAHMAVKGALELPIWGMVDALSKEDGVAGWPRARVPYLQWANVREDAQPHGADRRRVRRNLMRKGQM